MYGDRPWDIPQRFTVDEDGDAVPTGGAFGAFGNEMALLRSDAIERQEVRELTADARERHKS